MPRYGIVSLLPRPAPTQFPRFSSFYDAIGRNTGNLLFTNAAWRQVGGDKERLNFVFDPDRANAEFDAVVIPAANWVNPGVDFGHVADGIEKLKIPVVVIGLGAQNAGYDVDIPLHEGMKRFLRAVFDRAASVSVRGEFTKDVLARLGYRNTQVTGCPSLYCDFRSFREPKLEAFDLKRSLIHATRYSASHAPYAREETPNRALFRFAYAEGIDLLYQSELEELALLFGFDEHDIFNNRTLMLIQEVYGATDWASLATYIREAGRTYVDVDEWSAAMTSYQFVYGTRLHGTIMALNSGVPAVLLHHDSRTREMAEFAAIPHIDANRADISPRGIRRAYEKLNLGKYYRRREENRAAYEDFLRENSVVTSDPRTIIK